MQSAKCRVLNAESEVPLNAKGKVRNAKCNSQSAISTLQFALMCPVLDGTAREIPIGDIRCVTNLENPHEACCMDRRLSRPSGARRGARVGARGARASDRR